MTHDPRIRMIVLGGGMSLDGECWVRGAVLSKPFRRLMLETLKTAHAAGKRDRCDVVPASAAA